MRALVLSLTLVVAGCSQGAPPSGGNAAVAQPQAVAAAPAQAAVTTTTGDAGAVGGCHGLSQADVQPLLSGPITAIKPAPSDPDSCVFSTAGFSSISVTVRSSGGKDTLQSWRKGPVAPVPGVGDDAVWEAAIQELVASKGDVLCTVTAMGPEVASATASTEGALCSKVFAGG
jgi:hypothetical protein